jgi:hypothetical protein
MPFMPPHGYRRVLGQDPVMRHTTTVRGELPGYYRERTDFETVCWISAGV